MSDNYLIWSNEHQLWWRPNSRGYTSDLDQAGRYTRDEAIVISVTAHDGWGDGEKVPDEIPVREEDALACQRHFDWAMGKNQDEG